MDLANDFHVTDRSVHVWSIHTDGDVADVARFWRVLSAPEQDKAARFRFETLRNSFILARGALKLLLGCYLDIRPDSVQFQYGGNQKPALAPEHRLKFNASHSGGLAVFAFTLDREIGVDVEHIRPIRDMKGIANRFFCPEEAAELMSLSASERERAFFLCWTRKEAYVKALGNGLSEPMDSFRVTVSPDAPAKFVHIAHDARAATKWTLHDLTLAPNYAGALTYADAPRLLRLPPTMKPLELLLAIRRTATSTAVS